MSVMCLVCVLFHGSLYPLFSILRNVFSPLFPSFFWNVVVMCMGGG